MLWWSLVCFTLLVCFYCSRPMWIILYWFVYFLYIFTINCIFYFFLKYFLYLYYLCVCFFIYFFYCITFYTLIYIYVTTPTRVRTSSPSGSRTRDSGAGGRRSNKVRQRLQPLASVARAPLLRSGEWGLHTALTGIHPIHIYIYIYTVYKSYL